MMFMLEKSKNKLEFVRHKNFHQVSVKKFEFKFSQHTCSIQP